MAPSLTPRGDRLTRPAGALNNPRCGRRSHHLSQKGTGGIAEGKPTCGTVRKQFARRIGEAAPELSALDSVINDLKSAAEVPAIIKTEKILVPDQTTIPENRELRRRIIELEVDVDLEPKMGTIEPIIGTKN